MPTNHLTIEKIDLLLNQASEMRGKNPRDSLLLCKDAYNFSEGIKYTKGSAKSNQIAAICCRKLAKFDDSLEYDNKALHLYTVLEDKSEQSKVLNSKANTYYSIRKYSKAIENYNLCINLLEKIGDKKFLIDVLSNKGLAHQESGEIETALNCYLQSIGLCNEIKTEVPYNLLNNVGIAYQELGDYKTSIKYFNSALKKEQLLNLVQDSSYSIGNIGISFCKMGDHLNAITYFTEALIIVKNSSDKYTESVIYLHLGKCYRISKYYPEAFKSLDRALRYFKDIKEKSSIAETYYELGELQLDLNDYKTSKDSFCEGLKIAAENDDSVNSINCRIGLFKIYRKFCDYDKAIAFLNDALDMAAKDNNIKKISEINEMMKNVYIESGNYEKAISLLETTYNNKRKLFELYNEKNIDKLIEQIETFKKEKENIPEYMLA